jgi:hypothetical protein
VPTPCWCHPEDRDRAVGNDDETEGMFGSLP